MTANVNTIEGAYLWTDALGRLAKESPSPKGFVEALDYIFFNETYVGNEVSLPTTGTWEPLTELLNRVTIYTAIQRNILPEAGLDAVADQIGLPGWEYVGQYNVTTTVKDRKNEVIKIAWELLNHRGTPYAIQRILEVFGYTSVIVIENVTVNIKYDGTFKYDGQVRYIGDLLNQMFNVELTSDHVIPIGGDEENAIIALINAYKKYRPELYQLRINDPGLRVVQVW